MPLLIRPQAREKNSGSASIAAHFSGLKGAIKEIFFFFKASFMFKKGYWCYHIYSYTSLPLVSVILNSDIMFTDSLMKFCFYGNA